MYYTVIVSPLRPEGGRIRTSDNLWGHVPDGTHGIGEGVCQLLGSAKVTELQAATIVK